MNPNRKKLDWKSLRGDKKLKAIVITIIKGNNISLIMIQNDKKVFFNFGSEQWIDYEKIQDSKMKKMLKGHALKRYEDFLKGYKKDMIQTNKVIKESKDFIEIADKFYMDFRTDRGNKIDIKLIEYEK